MVTVKDISRRTILTKGGGIGVVITTIQVLV